MLQWLLVTLPRHSTQSMLLHSLTIWSIIIVLPAQLASTAWTARAMTSKCAAFLAAECQQRGRGWTHCAHTSGVAGGWVSPRLVSIHRQPPRPEQAVRRAV